ncbi:hypothetical protein OsI_32088 [Oryza sativa Indica Group]|uniref:Uncharacterized protein n=1 Tax=Oryza sativa subsp. indica TaxID=39946 RepID=A2Z390_ORYSI|nr:hypothetical protein OsI_32088 [Oryza sativa Indica Group]
MFRVDSDLVLLNGREALQADAEVGRDDRVHAVIRCSASTSTTGGGAACSGMSRAYGASNAMTPRASNLTGVEIYSLVEMKWKERSGTTKTATMAKRRGGWGNDATRMVAGEQERQASQAPDYDGNLHVLMIKRRDEVNK